MISGTTENNTSKLYPLRVPLRVPFGVPLSVPLGIPRRVHLRAPTRVLGLGYNLLR